MRGHGEGSYFKRTINGIEYWVKEVTLPDGTRKNFYGRDKKDIKPKETAFLRKQLLGEHDYSDIRLHKFLDYWMDTAIKGERAPATVESYAYVVKRIKKYMTNRRIADIKPHHVHEAINKVKKDKSPRTAQYTRTVLGMALRAAVKWEMLNRNPVELTDAPRVEQHQFIPLTREQAQKFVDALSGERLERLFIFALSLGLRFGEVCALRWSDISGNVLSVRQGMSRAGGEVHFRKPKTARSKRQFVLTPELLSLLNKQKSVQEHQKSKAKEWHDYGLIFSTSTGNAYRNENVRRRYKEILLKLELPLTLRLHDLRHTCATLLYEKVGDIRQVMEYMGHAQISTTGDIYTHIFPEMKAKAVADMSDMLLKSDVKSDVKPKKKGSGNPPEPA